jgi:ubiquitin C-terminal hydrolase
MGWGVSKLIVKQLILLKNDLIDNTPCKGLSIDGSIDNGHYTAYVKNKARKWVEYNDSRVVVLEKEPSQKVQEVYLYFYQAD